jgi:hypothetical protein
MARPGSVVLPNNERPFNPSRQTAFLLSSAGSIGPQTKALCQQMFDTEGRVGQRAMWGIVGLSRKYPARLVEQACAHAIGNRIYRYKHVRATVQRLFEQALEQVTAAPQLALPLTQDHLLIRPAAEYGELFSRAAAATMACENSDDDNPRSCRQRNPGQLRRHERSRGFSPPNRRPNHMTMTMPEIERCLRQLRLSGVRDTLQTRVLQAQGANQPFLETFSLILQDELDRRQSRLIERISVMVSGDFTRW